MRPIDADALKEDMLKEADWWNPSNIWIAHDIIDKAPTIDLVKHGTWKEINHTCGYLRTCSECGWSTDTVWHEGSLENEKFCPNCDADMRGEVNENKVCCND